MAKEIEVGDVLTFKEVTRLYSVGHVRVTYLQGTEVEVTQVFRDGGFRIRGRASAYGTSDLWTARVEASEIDQYFSFEEGEKPRKLGDVPEGSIAPDDPRLAWLWEDAGKLANRLGHCSAYDSMCDTLGIPGRERDFTVTREIAGGIKGSFTVKARSRRQADEQVDAQLKTAVK